MINNDLIERILDHIEDYESKLLIWGIVDVYQTKEEIENIIFQIIDKWDLSDFSSRLESLNNDSEKRIKIAYNAQKNYTKFTSSNGASIHFINHLKGILN